VSKENAWWALNSRNRIRQSVGAQNNLHAKQRTLGGASMASLFHVYFPGKSFELDSSRFVQVDTQRWVMDMSIYVGED
jgi:hypothetical protein